MKKDAKLIRLIINIIFAKQCVIRLEKVVIWIIWGRGIHNRIRYWDITYYIAIQNLILLKELSAWIKLIILFLFTRSEAFMRNGYYLSFKPCMYKCLLFLYYLNKGIVSC